MDHEDLFVAIRVIAELKPHDKLGIYAGHITIHPSNTLLEKIATVLKRSVRFESKAVSYEFIRLCTGMIIKEITARVEDKDVPFLTRLSGHLSDMAQGIANLCVTYENDVNMVAKLKGQIDQIGQYLDIIQVSCKTLNCHVEDNM
jgi:hypothetical protein